ncbi:hypothetical protein A9G43_00850 [Gilliamella sp. Occ3-1]|uniref:hypothetical protein n=1 Tax=Gilliamella sp. Occ3-1 TaxID=3120253 RepID=UPI00080E3F72|nr:hypothetical protein [Gilliamella apicola]OCG69500.1 hypothetical protein A9G43_00850 [Gilliamella apicola]
MRFIYLYLSLTLLLPLSGCSSPPEPVPFPRGKDVAVNKISVEKTVGTIKNTKDNGNWCVTESIYIDKNTIQSTTSDLIKINYLLDHADKITLHGKLELIQRIQTFIKLSRNTTNIVLVPECFNFNQNYCSSRVTATFEKIKKS